MKNFLWFRNLTFATAFTIVLTIALCCANGYAKSKKVKFYDFSEQQISGEIKKANHFVCDI